MLDPTSPPVDPRLEADASKGAFGELQSALGQDFDVVRRLGSGSMAAVYLAKERALDRLVALKVLHPGRARDETARRRFEREARAAASLAHPNVVQVFRFGRLPDETPYLVMRFVKGRTMEERLRAEGRLPFSLAKQVLLDVASALAAAHERGIVHRDVRPGNVLWDEESESAMLADFGIAAILATSGEDVTRLTQAGQMLGDPKYLSPEQLRDEDLTELADMYALGVLGYELLTGTGPYEAKTNMQWIAAHLEGVPLDLPSIRPDVDPEVARLLERCLERNPNHRPRARDAARILKGEQALSDPTGPGGREDIRELIKRRVPQIVLIAAAAGWALMEVMSQLTERILDPIFYALTLPFVGCGIAAATVVAWFHGERGKQQAHVIEWILLGVIAAIWLALTAWIAAGWNG